MFTDNEDKNNRIKIIIGRYMLSSEEIMIAMNLSQSAFSRFIKKTNLKPTRTIGRKHFYHVLSFEKAIREETNILETFELIQEYKKILEKES